MAVNTVPLFAAALPNPEMADDISDFEKRRTAARRALAEALKGQPIQHWTQGAAQMAQAALAGYDEYRARADQKAAQREMAELLSGLYGGKGGGSSRSVAPTGQPTPSMRSAPRPAPAAPMDTLPAAPARPAPEPPPRPPVAPLDMAPPPPPPQMPSLDIPGDMGAELGGMMPGAAGFAPPPELMAPPPPPPPPEPPPMPDRTGQFAAPGLMPPPEPQLIQPPTEIYRGTEPSMQPQSAAPIEPPPPTPPPMPTRPMGDQGLGSYGVPPVTPSYPDVSRRGLVDAAGLRGGQPPMPPEAPPSRPLQTVPDAGAALQPMAPGRPVPTQTMGRVNGPDLPYARDSVPPTYDARNIPINDYSKGRQSTPMRSVDGVMAHDVSGISLEKEYTKALRKGFEGSIDQFRRMEERRGVRFGAPEDYTGGAYHMTFSPKGINLTRPLDQRAPHAAAFNPTHLGLSRSAMEGDPIGGQELENGRKAVAYLMQTQGLGAKDFVTHPGAGPRATTKGGKDPQEGAWLPEAIKPPLDAIKDVKSPVPLQGGILGSAPKSVNTQLVSGGTSESLISPTGPQINRQPTAPASGMIHLAQQGQVDAETFKKMMLNPYTRGMALQMLQKQMDPNADLDRRYKEAQIKRLEAQAAGKAGGMPSNVQEWEYYSKLGPEDQEKYRAMKRGGNFAVVGDEMYRKDSGEAVRKVGPQIAAGEAAKKIGAAQGTAVAELPGATQRIGMITSSFDRLEESAKGLLNSPSLGKVAGGLYEKYAPNLTEGARNAGTELENLKVKISGQVLQSMRDMSKTGGAVGQVTEREWPRLENMIANLDPSQGMEQFKKNLQAVVTYAQQIKQMMREAYQQEVGFAKSGTVNMGGGATFGVPQSNASGWSIKRLD